MQTKKTMLTLVLAGLLSGLWLLGGAALAQTPPAGSNEEEVIEVFARTTILNIAEGLDIEGVLVGPAASQFFGKAPPNHPCMIKVRTNFHDKVLQSARAL